MSQVRKTEIGPSISKTCCNIFMSDQITYNIMKIKNQNVYELNLISGGFQVWQAVRPMESRRDDVCCMMTYPNVSNLHNISPLGTSSYVATHPSADRADRSVPGLREDSAISASSTSSPTYSMECLNSTQKNGAAYQDQPRISSEDCLLRTQRKGWVPETS